MRLFPYLAGTLKSVTGAIVAHPYSNVATKFVAVALKFLNHCESCQAAAR